MWSALEAVSCGTGDSLAKEQADATSKEDAVKALSKAASSLRAKLGESLASVQKFDVPIEATTPSLEALKTFSMGVTTQNMQGDAEAVPFLRRAIELDPNFAMAYARLGVSYANLGQPSLAAENLKKAYDLREHVSERERFHITADYYRNATGEMEKEAQTYELWIQSYPRDPTPYINLGANYATFGEYQKSLEVTQEGQKLDPNSVNTSGNLVEDLLALNRMDEAKAIVDQTLARGIDGGYLRQVMYYSDFLHGDTARMEQELTWAAGKPGDEDPLLSAQSDTDAYYGRLTKARDFSRRAVDSAVRADSKETAALWQVNAALREAEFGNPTQAKAGIVSALALAPGRDVNVLAALAFARAGEGARARSIVEALQKANPSNTVLKLYWLPILNAAIELNSNNPAQALVTLEATAPYDLGGPAPMQFGTLYPAYLRGEAYLRQGNGAAAAAEFQKFLGHRGLTVNFPLGALAHLQLGRAYAMSGDSAKARSAYQDFFNLWKDADPDIPILKEAKVEFEKLK